jgi:hypothetical protein
MCSADLRYIEKEIGIKLIEDKNDDIPLAHLTHGFTWYNFFKKLNLPLEASTRYAKAFENEGLGESDVERLTHRKMKSLGMSEKHVQRVQRFIETNVPEPPSDDERPRGGISTGKKKVKKTVTFGATSVIQDNFVGYDEVYNPADIQSQIQADEEYARQLQQQEEANTYSNQHHANGGLHRRGTGRPTPAHTAPRDVSTSAFSQFNISSEPLKPTPASVSSQPPLAPVAAATITAQSMTPPQSSSVPNSGFEDDAWAPRAANLSFTPSAPISHINPVQINNSSNSPLAQPPTQPLGQSLTLEQVNNTRPVPQIPGRQRPTPQSSQQNLVDPQLLAKWKGSPSLAAANTRPVPLPPAQNISSSASLSNQVSSSPNHANATAASVFAQQSQQQGGSGFFSSPANMSPATNIIQNGSMTPPPPPQMMGANVSLQPELQPVLVPNSVSPLSNQSTGLHPQIQQQPAGFGTPTMFNNVQSQQPTGFNPQYQQPTGFGAAGAQVQQPTGFGLQPQMTGYTQQAHQVAGMNTVPVSTQATGVPAAAFGPQSTGSSINSTWSNASKRLNWFRAYILK